VATGREVLQPNEGKIRESFSKPHEATLIGGGKETKRVLEGVEKEGGRLEHTKGN